LGNSELLGYFLLLSPLTVFEFIRIFLPMRNNYIPFNKSTTGKEIPMNSLTIACPSCGTKNRIPAGKQHLSPKCGKCKQPINPVSQAVPVELTDSDFQPFIAESSLPVMVDFYSTTCGPCKAIAPLIKKLSSDYLGKVIIAKLDTGTNPGTAMHYKIRGVPSLLFFKQGQMADQIVGAPPEGQLRQKLDSIS
jgi:thioredoxin 2